MRLNRRAALLAIVALFTLLQSIAGAQRTLSDALDRLFDEAALGEETRFGAIVVDVDTGRVVYERNATQSMRPASLQKTILAAAAMDVLGPERRFVTRLETDGVVRRGILYGSLRLIGGGDPAFGPRFQIDRDDITKVFRDFAKDLKARGIERIEGNVYGDDTLFADDRFGSGWPERERGEWYCAEVSALTFNDNCVDVYLKAGKKTGVPPTMTVSPKTDYVRIVNSARVSGPGAPEFDVRFVRNPSGNEIVARGLLKREEDRHDWAAVPNPALYAATVLRETLEAEGITVKGVIRPWRGMTAIDWPTTASLTLTTHNSAPVSTILPVVLAFSQNLYAEILLRHLALAGGKESTFSGGGQALSAWMAATGAPMGGVAFTDGSGLSRHNRQTPAALAHVLVWTARQPWFESYRTALAQPGERGSLSSRFEPAERTELRNRLWAKTGYISRTQSLGGYLRGIAGGKYAFVLMVNDYSAENAQARRFVERAALELARSAELP